MAEPHRASMRPAPSWNSPRRTFEERLQNLHKCNNFTHLKQLHAQIIKRDIHQHPHVAPKLLLGLSQFPQFDYVLSAFNCVESPNTFLFNTLIRVAPNPSFAFAAFSDMRSRGVAVDSYTYSFLIKSLGAKSSTRIIQMVHAHVVKLGMLGDMFVPNSLIDGYFKCGRCGAAMASMLFESMGKRDVVTWNSLVSGLFKGGDLDGARKVFEEMPERDVISWNAMLDGYVKAGEMELAFELFDRMPLRNVVSWSTMVWGYVNVGDLETAGMLFEKMPKRNMVSYTIIISGYAEKGRVNEALRLYDDMKVTGIAIDEGAIVTILAACAQSGMVELGEKLHLSMNGKTYSTKVFNALIDMYGKSGRIEKARQLFEEMTHRDTVSWNIILYGMAISGNGDQTISLFERMKESEHKPDTFTMVALLCGCSHSGRVEEGIKYFKSMEEEYGIVPAMEHYGCAIDLLGRAGRIEEALGVIARMPMEPNDVIWGILLGACRMRGGEGIAEVSRQMGTVDAGNYSMIARISAAEGDWATFRDMRMRIRSARREGDSGVSSIQVNNEPHDFEVFDKLPFKANRIYQMVSQIRMNMTQPQTTM